MKEVWSQAIPEIASVYAARRSPDTPEAIGDDLRGQSQGETGESALKVARVLMNHPRIGQLLNNMHQQGLDTSTSAGRAMFGMLGCSPSLSGP